ncbi:MAG: type II secretion system F family protein [Anaerohalosphaeraceae bacterium]
MKTFEYVAWDTQGTCREGVRQAGSQEEILAILRDELLTPVSIRERMSEAASKIATVRGKSVKSQDLASFCWQLGTMISGGLPITTAIETIAEEVPNKYFEHVLKTMSERMQQGQSLSEIASDYPKVFNKLACALLQAGETAGTITSSLQRLGEYYESRDKLVRKVRGALAYPIFVVFFIIGIVVALMTLIIPRFTLMFDQFKGNLPAFTRGFMAVYNFLMGNALFILLGLALVVVAIVITSRTPKGRRFFSRMMLKLPLIGPITKMAFIAQFCKTLSTLIASGVSVLDAFGILANMTNNQMFREGVIKTREHIVEGTNISKSMELVGFFPGVAVKMTQIGEQSGSLSAVLDKTSYYYEKKVDGLITIMLGLIEPVLIVSVGAIVLVVVLAMYLPIFSIQV